MRRFYSPQGKTPQGIVELGPDEARHLRDVLRLGKGDEVSVFDGLGHEFLCTVESVARNGSILRIAREIPPVSPESPLFLTVAAAILPGDRFEITVQKAAELGVVRLQPLFTARCEVKPGGSSRRSERWQKISIESAKQSGRATLMKIDEPVDYKGFIDATRVSAETGTNILFSERDGVGFDAIAGSARMTAVFGPKGGWDDDELERARDAGFTVVTFGGRIVRAETAAIAMTAILQHRFGDLV
ncbi:MAG TPA: RsmE family RNA methyltransferase [Pyrinomonadaceae bacterium]|nr:RsmE family RNA methyltransferase [Pyrinomonadaceae bacterium]